ncbi:PIG-L deacetylase family protein [Rubrobacter aplysinae]|uniref:PIG-L deacetylase family protein n=1 Tax=Rubrobacter aplysinae TaxID=909625 RepID=UPI00064B8B6A|nr:PIG-L family deacetylase [Rubrobacter aplysinae]
MNNNARNRSPAALFVSPHLDDVAFSCGGTAARLSRLGWRVTLATVFAASVPEPGGFALACQTDKGIPETVDYMELRRAEDAAACRELGADPVHLAHPEAPHRGYESAEELFSGVLPGDEAHLAAGESLAALIRDTEPELVFAPQGLGGHVDHLQVIRALGALAETGRILQSQAPRTLYYRDTPYALRAPEATPRVPTPPEVSETGVVMRNELEDKLRACGAYESQLGFQFGGVGEMGRDLEEFSLSEGRRLGYGAPAEAFLAGPVALEALGDAVGGAHEV